MTFNLWTFLFEVLNFLVLAAVLRWLLYRPLREAIEQRQRDNAQAREEAEKARQEAAETHSRLQHMLTEQEKQRQELIHQAHEQAEAERKRLLTEAERTIQRRQEETRQALSREREEAIQELRGELTHMALDLAQRLLASAADRTLHWQLALRLIETLRNLPAEEQQRLRRHWQSADGAVLETAGDLDGTILPQVADALHAALGQAVTPEVRERPDLLGGVRLRLGGDLWDASLAGQLTAVQGEPVCRS